MIKFYSWLKSVIIPVMLVLCMFWLAVTVLEAVEVSQPDLKEVMPEAEIFVKKQMPYPYYEAYKPGQPENTLVGLCFLSTDVTPEEKGYNGPLKILVGMNLKGVITGIKIIEHHETLAYVEGIYEPRFRQQFIGKTVFDPLEIGKDIDGISGATITSQAIVRSVRKGIRQLASQVLSMRSLPAESSQQNEFKNFFQDHQIYIFIGLVLLTIISYLTKKRILWYIVLSISFLYLGLIRANFISLQHLVRIAGRDFPPLTGALFWFLFIGVVLSMTIIWGRVYCGYLCPFGALNQGLRKIISPRVYQLDISPSWHRRIRGFKYWIVLIVILVFYLTQKTQVLNYEVYITFFTRQGSLLAWILLIFVLLVSLMRPYFWCQYLCPVGALLGLISRISIFKLRLKCSQNQKKGSCRRCVSACFMHAIDQSTLQVNQAECIRCNECHRVCPLEKGGSR